MPYTIASDICEGMGDCIAVCPTECIAFEPVRRNAKGTRYAVVNPNRCIDCGACLAVCPIASAIHDTWRPDLVAGPDSGPYRLH